VLPGFHERNLRERDPQQMAQYAYSIPCQYSKSYSGESSRSLAMRLIKHRHNFQQGLLDKSKLVQHSYEEGKRVIWDEASILEINATADWSQFSLHRWGQQ
jgi:hypothetical protein